MKNIIKFLLEKLKMIKEKISSAILQKLSNSIVKDIINTKIKDIGKIHEIRYADKKFNITLTLNGLDDRKIDIICNTIYISVNGTHITLKNFESNMPFAQNSLNMFVAGTYEIPNKMCSHFIMRRLRGALGLTYAETYEQQNTPTISSDNSIKQTESNDSKNLSISTIIDGVKDVSNSINFAGKFEEGFRQCRESIKKPSILVLGGTGVGKSTLVNLLLKKEVAIAGSGKPVTSGINYYSNDLINIYDSEGYEIGSENQDRINDLIFNFIEEKSQSVESAINVILYCISGPSARITDTDINFMKKLKQKNIPLALVITQIDVATEEQCDNIKQIALESIPNLNIFESYKEDEVSEPITLEKGLDELNAWVMDVLPEALKFAYLSVSNRNLEEKFSKGSTIIYQHIAISFTAGFSPIPISDAPVIFANQMGMIARLASLWDLGSIQSVISAGVLEPVLSTIGKAIAGNIIKMIPGIGTLVGGMINGAVGAALTYGLGQAVNITCKKICEAQLEGKDVNIPDFFSNDFIGLVKRYFDEFKSSDKFSEILSKFNPLK